MGSPMDNGHFGLHSASQQVTPGAGGGLHMPKKSGWRLIEKWARTTRHMRKFFFSFRALEYIDISIIKTENWTAFS